MAKTTSQERSLKEAAKSGDMDAMRVYADWLEEKGRNLEAAKLRGKVGDSLILYEVWDPVDKRRRSRLYKNRTSATTHATSLPKHLADRVQVRLLEYKLVTAEDLKVDIKSKETYKWCRKHKDNRYVWDDERERWVLRGSWDT